MVFLGLMVLLPRAVHKKMENWLKCLWHSQVRKWFHVPSPAVCFLVDNPPEDPTDSIKISLPVTERQGMGIVKQKEETIAI